MFSPQLNYGFIARAEPRNEPGLELGIMRAVDPL
jgi:hypothetical protein